MRTRSTTGATLLGWGMFCGIPATLVAFAITGPLGLLVLAATVAAIWIGNHLEREQDALDRIEADRAAREEPQTPARSHRRRRRYIPPCQDARGAERIFIGVDDIALEPAALDDDAARACCVLCGESWDVLFATPRIVLCDGCVARLRDCCGGEIGLLQWKVCNFLREEWKLEAPLGHYVDALNGVLGQDLSGCSLDDRLNEHMMDDLGLDGWRCALRAYHLGLTATYPPEERPDDDEWKSLAHRIRVQDGMCCVACCACDTELHVHHIIPLSEGGSNDPRNLVTLCHDCHLAQHPHGNFSLSVPSMDDEADSAEMFQSPTEPRSGA